MTRRDRFIYFAYGSNMLHARLAARTPSATNVGTGYVNGRRLTFHMSSRDGSGKCDIEPSNEPNHRVFGVLYEIEIAEKPDIDRVEGLGTGYDAEVVTVVTAAGPVEAIAYVALVRDPTMRPYHWYKDIVVAGAEEHTLPNDYIAGLRAVSSIPDPDSERNERHAALLPQPATPDTRTRRP